MELNPYWNVPQSIIRKEIIPTYRRDTTYFTRNRMKVYDKNGTQVDPHSIKWAKYAGKGVPYTVKQDNKAGNSLGRIISVSRTLIPFICMIRLPSGLSVGRTAQ